VRNRPTPSVLPIEHDFLRFYRLDP
jgi:hypothetical protein